MTLPNLPIVTLHRSDSSGDTFLFTPFLSDTDPIGWGKSVGFNTTVHFPNAPGALGEMGNSGMVAGCKATPGCIAYVGISYLTQALQSGLGYAQLQNAKKQFVLPTPASDRGRSGGLHQEDAGQRDDLAHLRQGQGRLPDRQLRVRHRERQAVQLEHGQEHPLGARVGRQPQRTGTAPPTWSQVNFQPLPARVVTQSLKQISKIK